jgi:hypothetical protein
MFRIPLLVLVLMGTCQASVRAESLPLVDEVEWAAFRVHGIELLSALKKIDVALPAETTKALQKLLGEKTPANPRVAGRAVQKLLDAHCLVGVHINPESRVKAARGERSAELVRDQTTYLLVKVHNDGGVTHPLAVASEQAIAEKKEADRWIELAILNDKPFVNRLSGKRVEYRVMKLVARQTGKREATLMFDVGQGTQDLGFRSEVPILFNVKARE